MAYDVTIRLKFIDDATGELQGAIGRIQSAFGGVEGSAMETITTLQGVVSSGNSSLSGLGAVLPAVGGKFGALAAVATTAIGGIAKVTAWGTQKVWGLFRGAYNKVKNILSETAAHAKWVSALMTQYVANALSNLFNLAGQFEQFGVAAEYLTGSAEAADKLSKGVVELSRNTIFGVDQIMTLSKRLVGSTRDVDRTLEAMLALADGVAATGGGYAELQSVTRAWIQTNQKAYASGEELNRQFAQHVPVLDVLSQAIADDLNHPLREYIETANSTGGASAKLQKDYTRSAEKVGYYGEQLDIQNKKLDEARDKYKEGSWQLDSAMSRQDEARKKWQNATDTINDYTKAQASANVVVKEFSAEEIRGQLADIGDLKIPGWLMADSITDALQKGYGGANQKLMGTFLAQVEKLKDNFVFAAVAIAGYDIEQRKVIEGGPLDRLTELLKTINNLLESNTERIKEFGMSLAQNQTFLAAFGGVLAGVVYPMFKGLIFMMLKSIAVWALIGLAVNWVVQRFGGWGAVIQKVTGWLKNFVGNVLPAFLVAHADVITKIVDIFVKFLNFLKNVFLLVQGNIMRGAVWIVTNAVALIIRGFAKMVTVTGKHMQSMIKEHGALWKDMIYFIAKAGYHIVKAVGNMMELIGNILTLDFGGILKSATTLFYNFVSGLVNFGIALGLKLRQVFADAMSKVADAINDLLDSEIVQKGLELLGIGEARIEVTGGGGGSWGGPSIEDTFHSTMESMISSMEEGWAAGEDTAAEAEAFAQNIVSGYSDILASIERFDFDNFNTQANSAADSILSLNDVMSNVYDSLKDIKLEFNSAEFKKGILTVAESMSNKFGDVKDLVEGIDTTNLAGAIGMLVNPFSVSGVGTPALDTTNWGAPDLMRAPPTTNNVAINFYGGVTVDSDERVNEIAVQVTEILGRQTELASYGAAV